MEGTQQKPKTCRFCRVRSFCRKPFPSPFQFSKAASDLLGSASGTAEMEDPTKVTSCRFCRVRSFCGSHFQGPFGFAGLDFRLLGPPEWRQPHNSPKVVDFVESAPFAEAISTLGFRIQGLGFSERPSVHKALVPGTHFQRLENHEKRGTHGRSRTVFGRSLGETERIRTSCWFSWQDTGGKRVRIFTRR